MSVAGQQSGLWEIFPQFVGVGIKIVRYLSFIVKTNPYKHMLDSEGLIFHIALS